MTLFVFFTLTILHHVLKARSHANNSTTPERSTTAYFLSPNNDFAAVSLFACYQCASATKILKQDQESPGCDTSSFAVLKNEEKTKWLSQCPPGRTDYCLKEVVVTHGYTNTSRACSDHYDDLGNVLKIGCMFIDRFPRKSYVICVCDTSGCNQGGQVGFVGGYFLAGLVGFVFKL